MNKYRIENPNNNKVREYKSRTTESLMMQSVKIPDSPLKGDNYKRINVNQLNSVIDYVKGGKAWKGR